MTRTYRYSWQALRGDYVRAVAGTILCAIPIIAVWGSVWATAILLGFVGLFVLFGVRTALRQASRYEVSEDGIAQIGLSTLPLGHAIVRWREVDRVKLAFYSTRRDRSQGWMHLRIRGGGQVIAIDSIIEGFDDIAARAAAAAAANSVALSDSTVRNFAALGFTVETAAGRAVSARRAGHL